MSHYRLDVGIVGFIRHWTSKNHTSRVTTPFESYYSLFLVAIPTEGVVMPLHAGSSLVGMGQVLYRGDRSILSVDVWDMTNITDPILIEILH